MNQEDKVEIQVIDANTLEVSTKAEIDSQVATAKQYPRKIVNATENAVAIATMDIETARSCSYTVPRAGKSITGPTIHMARIIAQQWGNLRISARVSQIGHKEIESEGVCHDLETNMAVRVSVKRSIWGKHGRYKDDMIVVTGNAANAIAMRNAILAVVPKSIVDKVYNSSQELITGDLSTDTKLTARRKKAFDHFEKEYAISKESILQSLGKKAMTQVKAADISVLLGIEQAIKDGDTTPELAFPDTPKEKAQGKSDAAMGALKESISK